MTEKGLFQLLNLNLHREKDRQKLDADAIVRAVQQDPSSADKKYKFKISPCSDQRCFPLHQAIALKAPAHVIHALSSPIALKAKCAGHRALHLALQYGAPQDVISVMLEKQPGAETKNNIYGNKPLHSACGHNVSLDVVMLLLNRCPDVLTKKNRFGDTPLHVACRKKAPLAIVSLLLSRHPEALNGKNRYDVTPLQLACQYETLDVVLMMLDSWLKDNMNRNSSSIESLKRYASCSESEDVRKLITHLSILYSNVRSKKNVSLVGVLSFFVRIQWWNGVDLAIDQHPVLVLLKLWIFTSTSWKIFSTWLSVVSNERGLIIDAKIHILK